MLGLLQLHFSSTLCVLQHNHHSYFIVLLKQLFIINMIYCQTEWYKSLSYQQMKIPVVLTKQSREYTEICGYYFNKLVPVVKQGTFFLTSLLNWLKVSRNLGIGVFYVSKSVSQSVLQPVSQSFSQPASQPASQSVSQSVSDNTKEGEMLYFHCEPSR